MADHLKCIFCKFQHVVVVQYTKQCFYWIPRPRKYVCRHQDIYPTLTIAGDIVNLVIFGNGHMADHLKCIIISCVYCILAGNYCLNVDRSLTIPSNGLVYVVFVRYLLVSHWSINAVAFRCTVWGDLNRCGIFHGFVCHSSLCD